MFFPLRVVPVLEANKSSHLSPIVKKQNILIYVS